MKLIFKIVVIGFTFLSGCVITQSDAQSMSPAESYYCAIDGGMHTALGIW